MLWLCGFALFSAHISRTASNLTAPSDAIIVLTGGPERINKGLDLLHGGHKGKHLLISGVDPRVSIGTLIALWRPAETDPAIPCCISLDSVARNTTENAAESARWLSSLPDQDQIKTLTLVTSAYHMPRAVLEFQAALPDLNIIAYPVATPRAPGTRTAYHVLLLSEYNKTILTKIKLCLRKMK